MKLKNVLQNLNGIESGLGCEEYSMANNNFEFFKEVDKCCPIISGPVSIIHTDFHGNVTNSGSDWVLAKAPCIYEKCLAYRPTDNDPTIGYCPVLSQYIKKLKSS